MSAAATVTGVGALQAGFPLIAVPGMDGKLPTHNDLAKVGEWRDLPYDDYLALHDMFMDMPACRRYLTQWEGKLLSRGVDLTEESPVFSDATKRDRQYKDFSTRGRSLATKMEVARICSGFALLTWDRHPEFGSVPAVVDPQSVRLQFRNNALGTALEFRVKSLAANPTGMGTMGTLTAPTHDPSPLNSTVPGDYVFRRPHLFSFVQYDPNPRTGASNGILACLVKAHHARELRRMCRAKLISDAAYNRPAYRLLPEDKPDKAAEEQRKNGDSVVRPCATPATSSMYAGRGGAGGGGGGGAHGRAGEWMMARERTLRTATLQMEQTNAQVLAARGGGKLTVTEPGLDMPAGEDGLIRLNPGETVQVHDPPPPPPDDSHEDEELDNMVAEMLGIPPRLYRGTHKSDLSRPAIDQDPVNQLFERHVMNSSEWIGGALQRLYNEMHRDDFRAQQRARAMASAAVEKRRVEAQRREAIRARQRAKLNRRRGRETEEGETDDDSDTEPDTDADERQPATSGAIADDPPYTEVKCTVAFPSATDFKYVELAYERGMMSHDEYTRRYAAQVLLPLDAVSAKPSLPEFTQKGGILDAQLLKSQIKLNECKTELDEKKADDTFELENERLKLDRDALANDKFVAQGQLKLGDKQATTQRLSALRTGGGAKRKR